MTPRLDAIEARLKAATPGPWGYREATSDLHEVFYTITSNNSPIGCFYPWEGTPLKMCLSNAEVASHAPANLTYLIERVRRLEAIIQAEYIQHQTFTKQPHCEFCVAVRALEKEAAP